MKRRPLAGLNARLDKRNEIVKLCESTDLVKMLVLLDFLYRDPYGKGTSKKGGELLRVVQRDR